MWLGFWTLQKVLLKEWLRVRSSAWAPSFFLHSFPFFFSSFFFCFLCYFLPRNPFQSSTSFRSFWWTSCCIAALRDIRAVYLGSSFVTAPKSVHCTAPVTSDVGENLWKIDYFSIVLSVYLQTAMGRDTNDVSPLTTEKARKTEIHSFRIFFCHIFGVFKINKFFNKKVGCGAGMAMIYHKERCLWMLPYHPATQK